MKVDVTISGGLRIETQNEQDWALLLCIIADIQNDQYDLANRLSHLVDREDEWQEFVTPELREGFHEQLTVVARALKKADDECEDEIREVFVNRSDADAWYGTLNQARLALEEKHELSKIEMETISTMSLSRQLAYVRDRRYLMLQYELLSTLM